jgi:hypothetical protein
LQVEISDDVKVCLSTFMLSYSCLSYVMRIAYLTAK